jgi:hypothetical protein
LERIDAQIICVPFSMRVIQISQDTFVDASVFYERKQLEKQIKLI